MEKVNPEVNEDQESISGPNKSEIKFLIFKYSLITLIAISVIAYAIEIPLGIRIIKLINHNNANTAFVTITDQKEDLFDRYINFDYDRNNKLSVKLFKR